MIGYLKGKIIDQGLKDVLILVSGVGYRVFTNTTFLDLKETDKEVEFFTYLAVRENALDLYGFSTKKELDFFQMLLTVSGIGPKSAMSILSVANITTLSSAIRSGSSASLIKISGIGKKNAEKIVLELKDKIIDKVDGEMLYIDDDSLEALTSLGYSEKQAREALKNSSGKTTEEKIKSALKYLNK
jgi:Holliday junction DNA helicase RuvA